MRKATQISSLDSGDVNDEVLELEELLGDFHPGRGNQIDSMLLFLITGREIDQCMKNWRKSSSGQTTYRADGGYEEYAVSSPRDLLLARELNDEMGSYGGIQ